MVELIADAPPTPPKEWAPYMHFRMIDRYQVIRMITIMATNYFSEYPAPVNHFLLLVEVHEF